MSAGLIVVYALAAAAVAATASTAIQAATTEKDTADLQGTWMETFFKAFAFNTVGGAVGSAGEGASGAEAGMSAAEQQAALEAGQSAQLVNAGVTGAETGAQTTAQIATSGMEQAELAAAEGFEQMGSFGEQAGSGLSAPNTSGQADPGLWDSVGNFKLSDVSPTDYLFNKMTGQDAAELGLSDYSTDADTALEWTNNNNDDSNPYAEQIRDARTRQLQFGADNPFTQQAKMQALEYGDVFSMLGFDTPEEYSDETLSGGFAF